MLTLLKIRNLALVDELAWELGPGLIGVTGETGAGKSVIVGALKLVLGERADKSLIRTGEDDGFPVYLQHVRLDEACPGKHTDAAKKGGCAPSGNASPPNHGPRQKYPERETGPRAMEDQKLKHWLSLERQSGKEMAGIRRCRPQEGGVA